MPKSPRAVDYDALILGAGAAGLAAAAELAREGRSTLVVEPRDRVGGRIWSRDEPGMPIPVELGAEFIHGRSQATFALLERSGLSAIDAPREHWTLRHGKLEPGERLFAEVRAAISATDALKKRDLPFQTFLDRHLKSALSDAAYRFALMLVQGFDAADPRRASARAIVEEWCGGGSAEAPQFRPLGGYRALVDALAGELNGSRVRLQLNTVIHAVAWKRGIVEARGTFLESAFKVRARQAIVALPLGVLQQGSVRFSPALSEKRQALRLLVPGQCSR